MAIASINPATGERVKEFSPFDDAEIEKRLTRAENASRKYRGTPFGQRSELMAAVAELLLLEKDRLAEIITLEMGKLFSASLEEVQKCARGCRFYADNAERFLEDEPAQTDAARSYVHYEPLGSVLAIMPWNFPFWQVFRYAAPTLMAGNVTMLKHAPNVCGCAKAIEQIFTEAGALAGVFQTLIIDTPVVEKLLEENIIQAVTLTGSERAGSSVAAIAGKNIKKSLLELGGSDALIVLPDADMKNAAAVAMQSRMLNAGQSCIGSKRFIVLKDAMDGFMQQVNEIIKTLKQGNPFDATITTGPMARLDLVENLHKQLQQSVTAGAQLAYGGEINGANFTPALLLKVQKGMAAFEEETFGPMAVVIEARDEAEAILLANSSEYGLAGSIWTNDLDKGIALARKITTGAVFINSLVKSDPRLPFGGIKKSGYGRELGRHGILEFVNAKTIAAMQS